MIEHCRVPLAPRFLQANAIYADFAVNSPTLREGLRVPPFVDNVVNPVVSGV